MGTLVEFPIPRPQRASCGADLNISAGILANAPCQASYHGANWEMSPAQFRSHMETLMLAEIPTTPIAMDVYDQILVDNIREGDIIRGSGSQISVVRLA